MNLDSSIGPFKENIPPAAQNQLSKSQQVYREIKSAYNNTKSELTDSEKETQRIYYQELKTEYYLTRHELSSIEKEIEKLSQKKVPLNIEQIKQLKLQKQKKQQNLASLNKQIGLIDGSFARAQLSQNPLNIDVFDLPNEAVIFLLDHIKNSKLLNKYSRLPAVKEAIQGLNANYENWNKMPDKAHLEGLKAILMYQHHNLEMLCKILNNFHEDKIVLNQIVLSPEMISKYFQQETLIEILDESALKQLQKQVQKIRQEIPKTITEEETKKISKKIKKQREESPITTKALEMQGKLFKAERKGKAWSTQQADLKDQDKSVNLVYQLKKPSSAYQKTVAYYKEGSGGEKATGTMEKLVWDIAVIMGLEEQFTPTKVTKIRTKASPFEKAETARTWSRNEELVKQTGLSKERKGGVQIAQEGVTLKEYLNDPSKQKKPISQEQLMKGTIGTIVFGMFDAHTSNIIIDDNGNIKFFDNTRSLPSSNGAILWGSKITSSYRSGLLELEGSFRKLTTWDKKQIREEIKRYDDRLAKLEAFFKSPVIKKRIESLPPGWFNSRESLSALKERIKNLKMAIDNPKVDNLRDLVFEANPDFKFFAALQIFLNATQEDTYITPEYERKHLGKVGYDSINSLIDDVQKLGIDTKKIKEMCESRSPSYQFDEIIIQLELDKTKFEMLNINDFINEAAKSEFTANELINEYYDQAKIDLKDIHRNAIPVRVHDIVVEQLKRKNFAVFPVDLSKDPKIIERIFKANKKLQVCIIDDESSMELKLCLRTSSGFETISLDYMKEIGKLVSSVDNQAYSIKEMAETLEDELNA